ncbi:MAG: carboxypeptidase regulatory-like domain-containing protein [Verrucomicrobiota bacterium]|nr:carboxypeptidase regulatory-like domain-containing protein [Verrucomicrobiota bacterium]
MVKSYGQVVIGKSLFLGALYDALGVWGGECRLWDSLIVDSDRGVLVRGGIADIRNNTVYGCRIGLHPHGGVSTIYNTIVSDSTSRGLWNSGGIQAYAYNNIWNSTEVNYYGMTDPTGTNGNISEDPVFKNPGNGGFYLGFGSPCIDHANGIMASESDFADAPRYDDPRSANTGIETGGQAFADLGAFEFVENAESDKDLVVVSMDGPGVVTAGGAVELRYRVANIGTASIQGPWVDRVGLVAQKPERGVEYLEAGIVSSGMLIGPGDQVECIASVTVPGGTEGEWRWQVQVNSGGDVFEGIHWRNNVTVSENSTTMQVPRLGVGGEGTGEFSSAGEDHWFSVVQPAGVELVADLDTAMEEGRCSLFVGYDSMPVDVAYDLRSAYWHSPDVRVGIPAPQNDRLVYLLVRPEVLTSGPIPFVVHVGEAGFELTGITCSTAGNAGELSFGLIGSGFVPEMIVRLERNGGLRTAHSLILQDSSSALATVDLMGAQAGTWDVVIELGGVRRRLEQALNVVTGIGGRLATRLVLPERVRAGRTFTGFIYYENTGDSNLEAPLFEVLGYNGNVILWETETFSGELSSARFLGVSQGRGMPSILAPGEGYSIAFEAVANMTNEARFKLFVKDPQATEPMDLSALESLVIPDVECDCWEQAWQIVRSTCGSTVGSYIGALTAAADRAAEFGLDLISERAVLTFMVREAAQTLESPILAGRILLSPGQAAGERLGVHLLPTDVALEDAEPIYTTLTWYDGAFGFSDILPGRYDLVVDGFARDPSWTFTVGGVGSDPLIGLELVPQAVAATVAGRITDGIDGPGIPEVAVYLSSPTRPVRTTISDEAGAFRFPNVALGDYSLGIVPVGWVPVSPVALSLEPGASIQHHFSLSQAGGMIRGSVFDPGGEPVQGACVDVRLRGTPGGFGLWEGTADLTDDYGGFFFSALPAGSFELIASKAGYAPSAGHFLRVQAGDLVSQVELQLREGGVLTGTVRDTSGQPLAQALVTVSGPTGSRCAEAVSDMLGEFRLEHLPLELVRITATLDGYAPSVLDQWITAPAVSEVELMLPVLGKIEGTVVRQGVGLRGIYVTLVGEDGVHQWVETDASGRFVFEGLLEGAYVVMLGHSGGLSAGRTEVMIDAGHQMQAVILEASCSLLSGRLLAADQHTPQAGGVVAVVLNGEVLDTREVARDGMFSFVVLEPGLYEFVARSDSGLYPPRQVMIEANTDSVMADWAPGIGEKEFAITDGESASAVAGAAVYLEWPLDDFGFMTLAEATDQAGSVHFSGLPEGEYRFAVHADGYPVARGGCVVDSGAGVETVPMISGNTISGVVHFEGLPVDDASVEFVSDAAGSGGHPTSSSDGSFETSLGTGSYDVVAYAVGGSGVWRTEDWFVKGPRSLDIEMTTAGAADVGGRVMDALGNPVWDAQVLVRLPGAGVFRAVRTDLDGSYLVLGLPVGAYVMEATSTGYNSTRVALLMEGGSQENVDLAMSAPLVLVQNTFDPAAKATAPLGAVAAYWPDWLTSKFWRDVTDGTYGMRPPRHFWDMLNADQRLNEYMDFYMSLDIYTQSCYLLQPKFKACMAADDRVRQAFDNWNDHYRLLQEVNVANLRVVAGQSALLGAKTAKLLMDISGMLSKLKGFGTSVSKDRIERINWYMERLTGAAGAIQGAPTKWDLASNASYTNGVLNELIAYLKELKRYQGVNTPFLDLINNVLGLIGDYQALASDYENLDKDALREFQRYQDDAHVFVESIKALHTAFREMKASAKLCNQEDGSDTNPAPTGLDEDDSADAEGGTGVVGSEDPNDKLTTGFGGQGFVDVDAPIHYTIRFENKSDATAPAQRVLITDQLSSELDWTSLELGEIGFNREVVPVPAGLTRFHTSGVHVLTDPNPVKVDARLDFNAGMITWVIESVDSVTGDLPEDPLAGFLPPNNELHVGDGYVRYSIKPRADLVDGTVITNEANIFFDYNAPINTPSTINTIDRAAPESWILGLAAQSWFRIHVQWGGTDIGTGIHRYDVYVSIDGGAPEIWWKGTTATSAIYLGEAGRTYEFWTIAYDALGHSEAPKAGSEHETTVVGFQGRIRGISSTSAGMLLLGFDQLRPGLGYSLERSISWPAQEWVPSGSFVPQAESYETTIPVPLDMESGFFRLAPP